MVLDILGFNSDSDKEGSIEESKKSKDESVDSNDVYYYALKKEQEIKFDF